MKAEIVSVGTEILLGEIIDTNAAYIASRLPALGIDLYYKHVVGDNLQRLSETFRQALEDCDLVICTGGLGPTEDDLTREAIADAMGETPEVNEEQLNVLKALWARRGQTNMPQRNLKQTWLIPSGRAIANPRGTAPGWWVEKDGKIVIAMPGPPAEMNRMWDEEVSPELLKRSDGNILITRTLKTVGIGEGMVDEMLSPLLKSTNPSIGLYARADGVHVRMAAKAATQEGARALIEPMEAQIRQVLGNAAVWGVDNETFEEVIGALLTKKKLTLATMESCTGGLLSNVITNVPGSSNYFRGGIVSYATDVKSQMGVDPKVIEEHSVYSPETARAMAKAARETLHADIGIATTGVAGPGPDGDVPAGQVYIAIDGGGHIPDQELSFLFSQSREAIKRRAVTQALMLLRRSLGA